MVTGAETQLIRLPTAESIYSDLFAAAAETWINSGLVAAIFSILILIGC